MTTVRISNGLYKRRPTNIIRILIRLYTRNNDYDYQTVSMYD